MNELDDLDKLRSELLSDPVVAAEYERLRPQYEVISQIVKARSEQGLTQAQLSARTGILQSNLSRLEGGSYNPSIGFLTRVAEGLGMELHIELRPQA